MSDKTGIQWTDSTWNAWWGCQRVGPGCDHCYAEALDKRTGGAHWGAKADRRRTSETNWNEPLREHRRTTVRLGIAHHMCGRCLGDLFCFVHSV